MADFDKEYKRLNGSQKRAVDTIYGPLLVVAGPGTGKTQLLSMRVANILRHADVLPRNILCLTFTESAATAMRERLLRLIGSDAHKVAIHTFHSFGVEVINQYPEYFYNGAEFSPSDGLLQIEILQDLLGRAGHDNPLISTMNGQFVYLRSIMSSIGNLKKAGLSPDDLSDILRHNREAVELLEPELSRFFSAGRLSKKDFPKLRQLAETLPAAGEQLPEPYPPLAELIQETLLEAVEAAEASGKTTAVTAWRNRWMEKSVDGGFKLKDRKRVDKFEALTDVYRSYQAEMLARSRFDFADMVLGVLEALEQEDELRFALQEQYQFVMVDEFQDTNDAQLRLLYRLLDNPVHEGRPDVMAVGDDDQAIYKFQGAEVNNIVDFKSNYPLAEVVTLTENYRSRQPILDLASAVIEQGEARLDNLLEEVDKSLEAKGDVAEGGMVARRLPAREHEYAWVAEEVSRLIKDGTAPEDIAILGRQHSHLEALMPHLRRKEVPVTYERRSNVLEQHHITQLLDMARAVEYLAQGEQELANEYVARILSFPFWETKPATIWRLSRSAYEERRLWLDIMLEGDNSYLKRVAEWLLELAQKAASEPLEYVVDALIGSSRVGNFRSPYRQFYFSDKRFSQARGEYIAFLSALRLLRESLRDYRARETVYMHDLIEFVQMHEDNGLSLVDETPFVAHESSVSVMTAHKAKGLEFGTVFILSCQEEVWAGRSGRKQLQSPANLVIDPPGDAFDDQLRLFFVAQTRAKSNLYLTGYIHGNKGKESLLVPWLDHDMFEEADIADNKLAPALEADWQSYLPLPKEADVKAVLKPVLDNYQLNVTALLKYLDVVRAGPAAFLQESLLRFPQAPRPAAAYGTAVHAVLKDVYNQLKAGESITIADSLDTFESLLLAQRLKEDEFKKYRDQGRQHLALFLDSRLPEFAPEHLVEADFSKQSVNIEAARISGRIDKVVLDKDKKRAQVYDFKTGKPLESWNRKSGNDGVKAWRYRTQLLFYKLLIENSRSWGDYRVESGGLEFVQPKDGHILVLESQLEREETERVARLIGAVWSRIQYLDFPDVSHYPKDLSGIKQFENDLLGEFEQGGAS